MPLLNQYSYFYFDTQGSNNEHLVIEDRSGSMFTRMSRWDDKKEDYFLIEFKSIIAFSKVDLTAYISEFIFSRIKDPSDKCFLALENFHEGFSNIISQIYRDIIDKYSIPEHKLILYTGALDFQEKLDEYVREHNRIPFKIATMLEFELSTQARHEIEIQEAGIPMPNTLVSKHYDKKFLNFNRRWRLHRPILTAMLKITDLLDKGYVSMAPADDGLSWESEMNHMMETVREHDGLYRAFHANRRVIENIGDLYLDKPDLSINQANIEVTDEIKKMYEDTYFSVVSETIYFTNHRDWEDSAFLSEKTFKAILFKHPFILVATPNTLKYLKSIGYKTFHPVIDESYDSIEDNMERLIAIVKEINRLCKLEGVMLEKFLEYCREITEHNYNVLINKQKYIFDHF